ncbi:MAG: PAS domain S-box protein [Chlorobiaceae bacterium]|nr:PAS domain S-box protein [Chlorobiaceae bacterium]
MLKKNIPSSNNETDISALLESLPDAVFIIDAQGIVLNANTLFASRFKLSPQECIGENISYLLSDVLGFPELATHIKQKAAEVFRHGERLTIDDKRDSFRVIINPVRSKENNVTKLLVSIENISRQKHVEEELEKERALKTALLEAMPGCAIILNAEGKLMVWNQYAHDIIFGKTDNIAERVDPIETICADHIFPVKKKFLNILHSGTEDSSEVKICPPGCNIPLWLATRGRRVIIDEKPCIVAVGVDISKQKQLEKDLIESKMRFNYALDASHSGIWEWDVETDRLNWSEQVWALYGLQINSMPLNNQLCVDTIHPEDREMASWVIKNAVDNQSPASVEYRVCHPDGSIHWLTSRGMPLRDDEGKVIRYIGTIIDITERKQIELELLENRSRLSQALEAARAGVWEWDLKSGKNIWSDEIWPLYGLKKLSGKPSFHLWSSTIHPDDREMAIRSVTFAAEQHTELSVEYRVIHPNGSVHWLMSRGKPVQEENGSVNRYIGTIIDVTESKQIEIALSDSKTRLNLALDATNAGIWEWNVKADKVSWSDRVWRLYGIEPDSRKTSHKLCETNLHPDDRDVTFRKVMAAALMEAEINVEYRVIHKDGITHWLMCRGMPLREEDDQVFCYIGTVIDITERKSIEEKSRQSQARLDFVLEKSHVGVWELNLDDYSAHQNLEHARIFGYESIMDGWTLEKFLNHVIPDDRAGIETIIRKSIERKKSYSFECRILDINGNIRWIWASGAFLSDKNSQTSSIAGIVQDITERKQTELALAENESKFRSIFDYAPVAISIWDQQDARLINVNTSWLQLLGFTREEAMNCPITDPYLYPDLEERKQIVTILNDNGRLLNRPVQLRKKNGELLNVLYSAEFIKLEDRTILLIMMTDVTLQELQQQNINRLEKTVADRTDQLQMEIERLERFISMVSHEYRTPLAIIRGNLDLIEVKNQSDNRLIKTEINKINRAIDRLVEIMEVSMHESRMIETQDTSEKSDVAIAPLIYSQIASFKNMWPDVDIRFSECLDASRIFAEPSQLKLAIFNLVDNARKYSTPGSPIVVDCQKEADEIVIRIRNRGTTITKDESETLFNKYQRGRHSMNTSGAGLGLWLVKKIVEQHNGKVTLKGIPSGVEAVLRLPLADKTG